MTSEAVLCTRHAVREDGDGNKHMMPLRELRNQAEG